MYKIEELENRIICGDALEILKEIPEESVDMVLTDPPFMISREMKITRSRNPLKHYKFKGKDINLYMGDWDVFKDEKEYWRFTYKWLELCWRVLKKGGHFLTFFDKFKITPLVKWVERHGGIPRQPLFWIKENPVPCVLGDSFLLTPQGLMKVKDYQGKLINMNGDFIESKRFEKFYNGEICKIYLYGVNIPLIVTKEHLIYSMKVEYCRLKRCPRENTICLPKFKGRNCPYSPRKENPQKRRPLIKCQRWCDYYTTTWNKAEDLKVGDYLVFPRKYNITQTEYIEVEFFTRGHHKIKEKEKIPINKETVRLLGFYLAEGSLLGKKGNGVSFCFSLKELEFCQEVKEIIEKYFKCKVSIKKLDWKYEIRVCNGKLRSFLEKCGDRLSYNKKLCEEILNLSPELLWELVWAYWQGDGCVVNDKKEKYIEFTTVSPYLAGQLFLILIRLGFVPSIKLEEPKVKPDMKIKRKHIAYYVFIKGKEQVERFLKRETIKFKYNHRSFVTDEFVYVPIRKIYKENYNGIVYDYETDGSFLTLNGIIHNCARKISFMNAVTLIFWATKYSTSRKFATFNYQEGQHPDYIFAPICSGKERYQYGFHPCQKPEKVIAWILKYLSNENDLILDPFAGSGTTCAVAKKMGRRYIGIEKDENYFKIAVERLRNINSLF
jgi:DNA modification methylase